MPKRLYRSRKDRVLGGVSGGIANYLGIDVVLIRLLWVILALLGGPGVIGYIICWIVIPEEPVRKPLKEEEGPLEPADSTEEEQVAAEGGGTEGEEESVHDGGRRTLGWFLILLGGYFLLRRLSGGLLLMVRNLFPRFYYFHWNHIWNTASSLFWPSLLVLVGLILIIGSLRRTRNGK